MDDAHSGVHRDEHAVVLVDSHGVASGAVDGVEVPALTGSELVVRATPKWARSTLRARESRNR